MEATKLNHTGSINALIDDLFDNTPIHVLQETLMNLEKVYSECMAKKSRPNDWPFQVENTMCQIGLIKDLLSSLSNIHADNESALKWAHTLRNQLN
jgi:hypothetical protein